MGLASDVVKSAVFPRIRTSVFLICKVVSLAVIYSDIFRTLISIEMILSCRKIALINDFK